MSTSRRKQNITSARRRYIVQLLCIRESEAGDCRYVARVCPCSARYVVHPRYCERAFKDDCELIAAINPLLPAGSDVRDVFGHIESPNGFFYLLWLTNEDALQLGWRASNGG
jgi:hypothetical protein